MSNTMLKESTHCIIFRGIQMLKNISGVSNQTGNTLNGVIMEKKTLLSRSILRFFSPWECLCFLKFTNEYLLSGMAPKLSLEKFVASMFYVFLHLSNINILLLIYFKSSFINHFIGLEIQFYNVTDYIAI